MSAGIRSLTRWPPSALQQGGECCSVFLKGVVPNLKANEFPKDLTVFCTPVPQPAEKPRTGRR